MTVDKEKLDWQSEKVPLEWTWMSTSSVPTRGRGLWGFFATLVVCALAFFLLEREARAQPPTGVADRGAAAELDTQPGATPAPSGLERTSDHDEAFSLEFGRTPDAHDRRVRNLRVAGWTLASAGLSWYPMLFAAFAVIDADDFHGGINLLAYGVVAPASLMLVGGACLIRARVMLWRKRRFLRRQSEGVEVSLAPLGAGLRLGLRW